MLYTAIMMGLAGSFHCAGMCSPLAMAVTRNNPFLLSSVLYNSGRILVYAILGSVAAAFGSFIQLFSYQQVISVVLGVLFILAGITYRSFRLPVFDGMISSFTMFLKKKFGVFLNKKSAPGTVVLGAILRWTELLRTP